MRNGNIWRFGVGDKSYDIFQNGKREIYNGNDNCVLF